MTTHLRLTNLIQADLAAGRKVLWLEVDGPDRAGLIAEIRKASGPVAKKMKASGIDVAMPSLEGVPLRWNAAKTMTKIKEKGRVTA